MQESKAINKILQKGEIAKRPLAERFSLSFAMTTFLLSGLLISASVVGYFAFNTLYKNKLMDSWAIMFLDLETQVGKLEESIQQLGADRRVRSKDLVLKLLADNSIETIQGSYPRALTIKDLGFEDKTMRGLNVIDLAGTGYLLSDLGAGLWRLRPLAASFFSAFFQRASERESSVYLTNKQGSLIYSNDQDIGAVNFVARPLVQKFIAAPLSQGQIEFKGDDGDAYYGFFQEIEGTGLVIFSEVSMTKALEPVWAISWRFLQIMGLMILVVIVFSQIVSMRLTEPIRELTRIADAVGRGYFDVKTKAKGFREISTLGGMVDLMAKNLLARDHAINKLMKEQTEKVRLEAELKIAQSVQGNLLPQENLTGKSGLQISAKYIPATECAGDWYNFYYNESAEETIFVIADVSGHGAGSSIFTAIIAGMFDSYKIEAQGAWDLERFMFGVNQVLYHRGRQKWHASMLLARYRRKDDEIDFAFAGHPPPFLHHPSKGLIGGLQNPANVLGLDLDFRPSQMTVPFEKGSSLLLYTDGLTEANNHDGRQMGKRNVRKIFAAHAKESAHTVTEQIVSSWSKHRDGEAATDDVCVMVVRAA